MSNFTDDQLSPLSYIPCHRSYWVFFPNYSTHFQQTCLPLSICFDICNTYNLRVYHWLELSLPELFYIYNCLRCLSWTPLNHTSCFFLKLNYVMIKLFPFYIFKQQFRYSIICLNSIKYINQKLPPHFTIQHWQNFFILTFKLSYFPLFIFRCRRSCIPLKSAVHLNVYELCIIDSPSSGYIVKCWFKLCVPNICAVICLILFPNKMSWMYTLLSPSFVLCYY